jgi:hypothetical protein
VHLFGPVPGALSFPKMSRWFTFLPQKFFKQDFHPYNPPVYVKNSLDLSFVEPNEQNGDEKTQNVDIKKNSKKVHLFPPPLPVQT